MSRRRQSRRKQKQRRHHVAVEPRPPSISTHLVSADAVQRLTYTRSQAAEALGVSVQTIDRRVVPAVDTVKTAWGSRLIPVSELERYLAEHIQPARLRPESAKRGRLATVPEEVWHLIGREHALRR